MIGGFHMIYDTCVPLSMYARWFMVFVYVQQTLRSHYKIGLSCWLFLLLTPSFSLSRSLCLLSRVCCNTPNSPVDPSIDSNPWFPPFCSFLVSDAPLLPLFQHFSVFFSSLSLSLRRFCSWIFLFYRYFFLPTSPFPLYPFPLSLAIVLWLLMPACYCVYSPRYAWKWITRGAF